MPLQRFKIKDFIVQGYIVQRTQQQSTSFSDTKLQYYKVQRAKIQRYDANEKSIFALFLRFIAAEKSEESITRRRKRGGKEEMCIWIHCKPDIDPDYLPRRHTTIELRRQRAFWTESEKSGRQSITERRKSMFWCRKRKTPPLA